MVLAVAAERNVHVLPEEGGQGYVPAVPEVRNAGGRVRVIEVLRVVKAQHFAEADGHVGVRRKVKVDLERIGKEPDPGADDRNRRQFAVQHGGGHFAGHVGQQDLFEHAGQEPDESVPRLAHADDAVLDLRFNVDVFDNGAGNELREHGDVQQQVKEVALDIGPPAVHIHNVRNGLERVEADADGQRQVQELQVRVENGVNVEREEIQIFKDKQEGQSHRDRGGHSRFCLPGAPVPVQDQSAHVFYKSTDDHQYDPLRFTPGVEKQGCQKQDQVPDFHVLYHEVQDEDNRQKEI